MPGMYKSSTYKAPGMKKEKNMTYTGTGNTMPMGRASYHYLSSGKRTTRSAK